MIINEKYVFDPQIEIDQATMEEIVRRQANNIDPNSPIHHHRWVKDEPYLISIREKYPFLSEIYSLYVFPAGLQVEIHTDSKRSTVLNIPVLNLENTITTFYKVIDEEYQPFNKQSKILMEYDSKAVVPDYSYTMLKPLILNASIPHSISVNGNLPRTIISWGMKKNYQEAMEFFKNQNGLTSS